ncbi:MAG: NADH-quinone oxidoreductase subunit NuoK [Candidatus Bathyarchaeia archaeon]
MLELYLGTTLLLVVVALYCFAAKRNMVRLVMAVEILINAANLAFIAFTAYRNAGTVDLLPQAVVTLSIAVAGSVTAIALTLVLNAYKHYKTIDVTELKRLRG